MAMALMIRVAVVFTIVMSTKDATEVAICAFRSTQLYSCFEVDCTFIESPMQSLNVCMGRWELRGIRSEPGSHVLDAHVDPLLNEYLQSLQPFHLRHIKPMVEVPAR